MPKTATLTRDQMRLGRVRLSEFGGAALDRRKILEHDPVPLSQYPMAPGEKKESEVNTMSLQLPLQ